MRLPAPRGPVSEQLFASFTDDKPVPEVGDDLTDDDRQIALWALYELHYRGFEDCTGEREWDPDCLALRRQLEAPFEAGLRRRAKPAVDEALARGATVVEQLDVVASRRGSGLPTFLERRATVDQFREFLMMRSLYHRKESDSHAWALPRLTGQAKAALAELLYDEFGNGQGERVHQELFAAALDGVGLDPAYGAYIDATPAHVLAVNNAMSLFGLHRRLRAADAGHLAAFEATSSTPCRRISRGAERLQLSPAVMRYYDEHVEADAVHEQLASRSICGSLVNEEPKLHEDVLFGAVVATMLEKASGVATLRDWAQGQSALRN